MYKISKSCSEIFMKFYENQNVKRRVQLCSKLKIKLKKNRERSERNRVWIELCTKPTKIKWKLNLLNTGGREIDVHSQYPYVLRHCLIKKGLNFLLTIFFLALFSKKKKLSSPENEIEGSVFEREREFREAVYIKKYMNLLKTEMKLNLF